MIDFNKLIDNYLIREYKPKQIGRYYPSEVGGCLRKTWFSYKIPKETDAKLLRVFESGNILHEFVTEVIRSEKNDEVELVDAEIPVKIETKDFIISGRIDNLVLVKINEKKVLVEVKSAKLLPKEANAGHEMQLQLYMHALAVNNGILLYIKKDNLETKWFDIDYDKKKVDNILERFEKLHEHLVSGNMPEAEAKIEAGKGWMCKFCNYDEECRE